MCHRKAMPVLLQSTYLRDLTNDQTLQPNPVNMKTDFA